MKSDQEKNSKQLKSDDKAQSDLRKIRGRREAVKKIGKLGLYTAPAMVALLSSSAMASSPPPG